MEVIATPQAVLLDRRIHPSRFAQAYLLSRCEPHRNLAGHGTGHLALQNHHIFGVALIAMRPEMLVPVGV
jgi:hypothetical protein